MGLRWTVQSKRGSLLNYLGALATRGKEECLVVTELLPRTAEICVEHEEPHAHGTKNSDIFC